MTTFHWSETVLNITNLKIMNSLNQQQRLIRIKSVDCYKMTAFSLQVLTLLSQVITQSVTFNVTTGNYFMAQESKVRWRLN